MIGFVPLGGLTHYGRRVLFGKSDHVALAHQPLIQQVYLGAFARAINALDNEQPPTQHSAIGHVAMDFLPEPVDIVACSGNGYT